MFFQSLLPSFNIAALQQQQQPEVPAEAGAAAPELIPPQEPVAQGETEG